MLTETQLKRYTRNILLPNVGAAGQEKLLQSRVLVVGSGGLGSPAAYYLAAAGVGHIGLVDSDKVDLSNLQRQILHRTEDIGRPKVASGAEKLRALNSDTEVIAVEKLITGENADDVVRSYDVIVDCTDNFSVRYLLNDACISQQKPMIFGGVLSFSGQLMTIMPGEGPCLRCLFREDPSPDASSCAEVGILGAVPGVIGALQSTEVIKYLLGLGNLLMGRLLTYDALTAAFFEVTLERDPSCPSCAQL
ncbi:MAG: adenylyltransferase [Peptococcaceae bacterium BRH_c4b]|nr:MAG: adenylyltransferase [Peptococcaceae bacterium BRH_c4b]